ncbi:MAG: flagellar hook-length control protein FliK [Clostridium sp.]|nr:flagellar hook-length control protein FliK [Clostridium sp.]
MKLSSYIGQINQTYTGNTGVESTPALEQGLKNGMDAVMGKQPGQTIAGEVLLRDGSDILIAIGKNQLLQARLEGGMNAQIGQLLTFQIKNNSNSRVVLSPLFENMGNDPNISKALQAAGLPENSVTAGMVKAMMQEGLPINRQSLYQMNRLVNLNPQADVQSLAQMQRLSIPATPENISQFEAYKNYQHQLGESLSDMMDAFTQSFQEIGGKGGLQEGLSFYRDVLGALLDGAKESGVAEVGQNLEGLAREEAAAGELPFSGKELEGLAQKMRQAGVPEQITQAVVDNRMGGQELLNQMQKLLMEDALPDKKAFFELLEGKEFKTLLKNEMSKQWLLTPEEVAEERSVDKLYERMNNQMNRLNQALSQNLRPDTPLAKTVSNVSDNINFMNQLNQMFTYVQIPLKMQGQNANGELFVYTNKKSLARKDGSVSALLHLDMEHLGSVDVHVSMTNQKVSTKFYLQDDSALDLIADHIDILNKRLESRGYSMNAEFINQTEDTNVMDEILKQGKNISALAGYSFDARA